MLMGRCANTRANAHYTALSELALTTRLKPSADSVDNSKESRNRFGASPTSKRRAPESTGDESDSGEDEEVAISTCLSKNTQGDGDSSSFSKGIIL